MGNWTGGWGWHGVMGALGWVVMGGVSLGLCLLGFYLVFVLLFLLVFVFSSLFGLFYSLFFFCLVGGNGVYDLMEGLAMMILWGDGWGWDLWDAGLSMGGVGFYDGGWDLLNVIGGIDGLWISMSMMVYGLIGYGFFNGDGGGGDVGFYGMYGLWAVCGVWGLLPFLWWLWIMLSSML